MEFASWAPVEQQGRIKCKQKSGRPFNRAAATREVGGEGKGEGKKKRNENVTNISWKGGNKTWSPRRLIRLLNSRLSQATVSPIIQYVVRP